LFFLVCFDISDNKKRRQAVKVLMTYGVRVQKSVFECPNLSDRQLAKMKTRLDEIIDHITDTCRFYALCRDCLRKTEYSGTGDPPNDDVFRVI
jgi:CRISPR-associated protein Cas2